MHVAFSLHLKPPCTSIGRSRTHELEANAGLHGVLECLKPHNPFQAERSEGFWYTGAAASQRIARIWATRSG